MIIIKYWRYVKLIRIFKINNFFLLKVLILISHLQNKRKSYFFFNCKYIKKVILLKKLVKMDFLTRKTLNFSFGNVRKRHWRKPLAAVRRLHLFHLLQSENFRSNMVEMFFEDFHAVSSRPGDRRKRNRPD